MPKETETKNGYEPEVDELQNKALAIRNCLSMLEDEALEAKLTMVALHLKLAIMEANETLRRTRTETKNQWRHAAG